MKLILTRFIMTTVLALTLSASSVFANLIESDVVARWRSDGLILGDESGDLKLDALVSRAEFMAFTNRLMGYNAKSPEVSAYKDVPRNAWYYDDVAKALQAGYIAGRSDAEMAPLDNIAKQEAVVIAMRIAGFDASNLNYSAPSEFVDIDLLSNWAKPYLIAALEKGVVKGENGRFNPTRPLSRMEVIDILDKINPFSPDYIAKNNGAASHENQTPEDFIDGDGSEDNPYVISTEAQLRGLAGKISSDGAFASRHYKLAADIDLRNEEFTPLPRFYGTFDGDGHIISNLRVTDAGLFSSGVFSTVSGGAIKNLGVRNALLKGEGQIGVIAGIFTGGEMKNCFVDGDLLIYAENDYAGGLVGYYAPTDAGLITDCYFTPSAESSITVGRNKNSLGGAGGIAGYSDGKIKNCYSSGVNFHGPACGNIVGIYGKKRLFENCLYITDFFTDPIGKKIPNDDITGLIEIPIGRLQTDTPLNGFDVNQWRFVKGKYPALSIFER
ncbi:MAG: S-layer homology domain-containing protein [Clostridiales bacterium]|jgi:hypothetical protein|nr:S-layer homology domain-containing protein [Clostridiales bacterium]